MKGSLMDCFALILKPQNECRFTGLETLKTFMRLDKARKVRLYVDNFNQYRVVLSINGKPASAVLVGKDKVIRFKYTDPDHRGHSYTRELQAMLTVWGIDWRRSDYLTEAGRACYEKV